MRRIVWLEQYSPADRGVLGGKNADPNEVTRAGTKIIETGRRIRVAGNTGTVIILRGSGLDSTE